MGYNTKFFLRPIVDLEQLAFMEMDWDTSYRENTNEVYAYGKWYNYDKDMKTLAKAFPDVIFTLEGYGEVPNDIWKATYHNNLDYRVKGHIVYETDKCPTIVVYSGLYQHRIPNVICHVLAQICEEDENEEEGSEDESEASEEGEASEGEAIEEGEASEEGEEAESLSCTRVNEQLTEFTKMFSNPIEARRIIDQLMMKRNNKAFDDFDDEITFTDIWPYVTAMYIKDGLCTNILGEEILLDTGLSKAFDSITGIVFQENLGDFNVLKCSWCHIFGFINHQIIPVDIGRSVVILHVDSESG